MKHGSVMVRESKLRFVQSSSLLSFLGTDDCGDHSDEMNCPSRMPRRIVTAAVIGATVCSTLFIIALGCTCKLFHLRSAERRAASRLLNPQRYIEERRQQMQREQQRRANRHHRHSTSTPSTDSPSVVSSEARRIAPPSYNQTMGLIDENEERQAALTEHLRLAGLANYIALPPLQTNSRSSRSTSRHRHRRHRRHRHHHHHHRRAHSEGNEGSRVALLEPTVVVPNNNFSVPSTSFSLNRLRSQLRALFAPNQPTISPAMTHHQNSIPTNPSENNERHSRPSATTPTRPVVVTTRSHLNSDFIQSRELPPPYTEEQSVPLNPPNISLSTTTINSRRNSNSGGGGSDIESTNPTTTTNPTPLLYRQRKRQVPVNTLRDRMRQFISGAAIRDEFGHPMQATTAINLEEQPPVASIEDDEQPSSDDDKMLTP